MDNRTASLQLAVDFYASRGAIPPESVIETADLFNKYLDGNIKPVQDISTYDDNCPATVKKVTKIKPVS